ncbi:zinc finger protein [Loa loa]|uniref:Zinc finger protein n=1 Tax=Loa loa TaxID=7209 RepID=A0A1S0TH73_LOALO|nr:zinc finger protein [Loa loa]EFO13783.1 zinc finger protein [Loa loa]
MITGGKNYYKGDGTITGQNIYSKLKEFSKSWENHRKSLCTSVEFIPKRCEEELPNEDIFETAPQLHYTSNKSKPFEYESMSLTASLTVARD